MKPTGASIQILSTKVLDNAIIREAASDNIIIDCIPFIETKPVADNRLADAIKTISNINTNVVFTSVNAVQAVAAQVQSSPSWNVFCISGATKNAVQKYFPKAQIVGATSYGSALAEIILKQNISELVFFCGNKRLNTIPEAASKAGIKLQEYVVYETGLTPVKINKGYNGFLFFSPSAVESFFSVNGADENSVLFSIGTTTALALKKYSDKVIISKETSERSIYESLIDYFSGPGGF